MSLFDYEQLYNRQQSVGLQIPSHVLTIGLGGVGSWVAIALAICGVNKFTLVDPDIVEESNLNRTLFRYGHIDMPKVYGIAEIIYDSRPTCEVVAYHKTFEQLDDWQKKQALAPGTVVLDCRDSVAILPGVDCPITGGYDGTKVTIHIKPNYDKVFGTGGPMLYRTTPSYACAPMLIGAIIANYVILEKHQRGGDLKEVIFNFDMKELVRTLMGKKPRKKKKATV
jgi:hypothetical protein